MTPLGLDDAVAPGEHDLYYVGGGQDREQLLVAENLTAKASALHEAVARGAAALAVCGGYQLLGRAIAASTARTCRASDSSPSRRRRGRGG